MSSTTHTPRSFLSAPRDYLERRRFRRRISNLILIPLLSLTAAYFITRQTGGSGIAPPKNLPAPAALPSTTAAGAAIAPEGPTAAVTPPVDPVAKGLYKSGDGPFRVTEVSDVVLRDGKRKKDLHVRVFYPSSAGKYPVIVFSHGAGGSQNCCESLTRHWASYGYVTLQPTHEDSTSLRRGAGEHDLNFARALRDALNDPEIWQSRPVDVSFLLDSLPELQKSIPALAGKVDAQHIGVGGHSMGAFTADAIAGALVNLPGHRATNFVDPRVSAVLLLSPQGPGEFGLDDQSWSQVAIPLLSMTGSLDSGAKGQSPEWREIPFDRSEAGGKYHVFIKGATHMSFVSAATLAHSRASLGQAILGYTNSASLAFWDAYLKSDEGAKRYLDSEALPDLSHGEVKISRR